MKKKATARAAKARAKKVQKRVELTRKIVAGPKTAPAADRGITAKAAASPEARQSSVAKPLDLATLKAPGRLEQLDPTKIDVNPHNPRRAAVDEKAQADFEDSIATQGILEPILVRPVHSLASREDATPGGPRSPHLPAGEASKARYQLVAGERRFKAALKAIAAKKLPADYRIPAMVKDLDNRQARLVALAENLARADMHPIDECREFAAAEDLGTPAADIAKATGAHLRNVQRRIKTWRDLPEDGKTAFGQDKITFSQAHAIAQIAHEKTKLAVLREVIRADTDYDRKRMNEDWIKRRAESVKHAYDQREADKANPKAAAKRKAERARMMAPHRSHERKISYPTPNAAGVYEWPAKIRDREIHNERRHFGGEVIEIGARTVAIRKDGSPGSYGSIHASGYVIRVKGWPTLEEPITEKNGSGRQWQMTSAADARAIDALLDTPPKANDPIARAWLRDAARIAGGVDEPKRRKALVEKLDALQAKLFPPAPPAATSTPSAAAVSPMPSSAAGPIAVPDKSAPLTEKLAVKLPAEATKPLPLPDLKGVKAATGHSFDKVRIVRGYLAPQRNPRAAAAGQPDLIVLEFEGQFFAYGFACAIDPASSTAAPELKGARDGAKTPEARPASAANDKTPAPAAAAE